MLPKLDALMRELRQTTLINEKIRMIREAPRDIHEFLHHLYSLGPLYLTSKSLDREIPNGPNDSIKHYENMHDLLHDLSTRSLSGHNAILAAQQLLRANPEYTELIRCIIDKDLRIRMGEKLILRAISRAKPDNFSVALAENYHDPHVRAYLEASLSAGDVWYASRKLDGVRCVVFLDDETQTVRMFSRQQKEMLHLGKIKEELQGIIPPGVVLDGELCHFALDKEHFRVAAGIVSEKENDGSALTFVVFDSIPKSAFFESGVSPLFSKRKIDLPASAHVRLLEQLAIRKISEVEAIIAKSSRDGWEGVILRRDVPHAGKRTKDMIKVKQFQDDEFKVISVQLGDIRVVDNGVERVERILSSIRIEYKGNHVDVGSGFSIEERRRFAREPVVGRWATICYFEESRNKCNDHFSIRFPVFKGFRDLEQ